MWSWLRDHLFKQVKERKERERDFLENGSKLLEKLIVSCNGKSIPIRTFSAKELSLATNNYHNHPYRGWWKGSLDRRFVDNGEK
jgi:hypothetical protein